MRAKKIEYDKVIAGQGSPLPFLRKGPRDELVAATGDRKLPTLRLQDGTVLKNSRAILRWVAKQPSQATSPETGASAMHFGLSPIIGWWRSGLFGWLLAC